ncbi:YhgE/Pip domain-containing protein [Bacillaceae bacterium CLA-AA-H227]|uniref:YhgE/Pip domain-containing protein n=1 Tax=Robertmurraya yapensis (ex Hitch et al 2024) TaxID=3133160 RepID=A0ACC6SFB1_9BACI
MEALKWFKAEMAKLTKNKGVLISIIAVLLIPIVYAAVLLSATWSPYDNLSNLPVAVVNKDVGAMSGDEEINVGRDLIEDFKKGRDLGWKFVSEEEAEKGLEDLDYYMVIEIPEDFSKNVTTVLEPEPQQLELRYIQNEGLNFMAAQVTNSATERIREQLGNKITETYVRNLFTQLGGLSDGVQSAADGSEQIYTGSSELKDGTGQLLTALTDKSGDIDKLASGAKQLEDGTLELMTTLTSKQGDISKLAGGAKDLNNGTSELLANLKGKSGDITALAAGAKELNGGTGLLLQTLKEKAPGVKELDAGAAGLDAGVAQFQKEAMGGLIAGLEKTQKGLGEKLPVFKETLGGLATSTIGLNTDASSTSATQLREQLVAYLDDGTIDNTEAQELLTLSQTVVADHAKIKASAGDVLKKVNSVIGEFSGLSSGEDSLVTGISQLVDGAKLANSKLTELKAGSTRLAAGADEINTGWNSLITNVSKLNQGAAQISAGNKTVETGWKTMTAGVTQLNSGSNQIYQGNVSVDQGWRQLSAGATQLNSGMKQVSDGTSTVQTGWGSLTDGVTQVDEGLVKLNAGSEELATGLKSGAEEASALDVTDDNIAMFSSPVELAPEKVNGYQYYRDSTAPYILSLGLFVGILLMSFVVDFRKPAEVTSGISWFIGKFLNLAVLAIIQAVVVSLFVLFVLNLQVGNSLAFILFACFVSLTFLTIIFFLVAAAGNIGRFIAFIFIVLQLSTTGSNLPIEMLPEGLRSLSAFLPLTYTNAGFKAIISLDNAGSAWGNTGILFGVLLAFLILAFVVVFFKKNRPTTVDVAK